MKLRYGLICLSIIYLFSCTEKKESFTEIYNVSDTLFTIGGESDPNNDFIIL